jgi:hypothetical protein
MNGRTGGNPGQRRAGTLTVVAAVAVLATGCGLVHVHVGSSGGSAPTGPATYRAELAYAQCMRTHGLPDFPTPGRSAASGFSTQTNASPNSPAARANAICRHLLLGR